MASGQTSCFFLFAARPRTRLVSSFVGRRLLLLRSYVTLARGARRSIFFGAGFVELRCRVWKLALGSGSWVGGIEIETFDELCLKKIYVLKSLNPKP